MKYNPALDGLRAVAVVAVVAFHSDRSLFPGGFIGVDVFFVLSGFLITSLLWRERLDTGAVAIGRFYWRRALRLYPPLLLMLAAFVTVAPVAFPGLPALREAMLTGLYLSDYSKAFWGVPTVLGHTWSLAVEEHFYLIWPVAILLLTRAPFRWALCILSGAYLLATAWRMLDIAWGLDFWHTYYRFDTRLSGLILGATIVLMPWRPGRVVAEMLAVVGLAGLMMALWSLQWRTTAPLALGGVAVDLLAGGLILGLASSERTFVHHALSWRPLVYVGAISYPIYLWHYPIVRSFRVAEDTLVLSLKQSIVVVVATLAIAALSYEFIERPLREFRRRKAVAVAAEAGPTRLASTPTQGLAMADANGCHTVMSSGEDHPRRNSPLPER